MKNLSSKARKTRSAAHWVVAGLCLFSLVPALGASDKVKLSADIIYDFNAFNGTLFDDQTDVNSRISHLRRFKGSLKYAITDRLDFKTSIEYDAWKDELGLDDAYFKYQFNRQWSLLAGQFKEPFGLENQQSLSTQYTLERSVPTNAFTFSRNPGLQLFYAKPRWQWQFAVTHVQSDDNDYSDSAAFTSRISGLPVEVDAGFIHLGAGITLRQASDNKYDIDEGLIANGVGNLIGSPKLKLKDLQGSNLEFAAAYGPLIWQGEYLLQKIQERNGTEHTFLGHYNTLMWTVHGKNRDYDQGEIKFDDRSKHTVELAIRYSFIDLETESDGDRARITTAAINYYFRSAFRFSLEYQSADMMKFDEDDDNVLVNGNSINVRLQLAF